MKYAIAMMILSAAMCCGQDKPTPCVGGVSPKEPNLCVPAAEYVRQYAIKPLTCGKYQHVDNACYISTETGGCLPARCVDDMHELTERDWRALMDRIKALEAKK